MTMREGRVRANGLEFAYLEAGDGPLALCLHGSSPTRPGRGDTCCRHHPMGQRGQHPAQRMVGPKVDWWWTQLLLGVAEGVLGVWAVRSWQRSLLTLVTLVGVWAIFLGGERDLRRVLPTRGRQAGGAAGRLIAAGRAAGQAHRGGMLGGAHPGSALPLVGV